MKKEYVEPSFETLEISDLLQGEVINPGTIPEGQPADSQQNNLIFEETEVSPHHKNLWDE